MFDSGNRDLHDENTSGKEIVKLGLMTQEQWNFVEDKAFKLFERGTEIAARNGLILVDTKYEFGYDEEGNIFLVDEIHTPDSSRYFYAEGYQDRQDKGEDQKQLSKEFVRQWLIENGFQGLKGQTIPEMTDKKISEISDRYIELYENITGKKFVKANTTNILDRIEKNVVAYLESLK